MKPNVLLAKKKNLEFSIQLNKVVTANKATKKIPNLFNVLDVI